MKNKETELGKFYNPTVESARNQSAEVKLKKLNGSSPVGKWIKGWYASLPVNGFVLCVIGYGIVNVHWVKNKIAFEGKGTVVGLHGKGFDFYDKDIELTKSDIDHLVDYGLKVRDFDWVKEFNKLGKRI